MHYYVNNHENQDFQVKRCQEELNRIAEKLPDKTKFEKYFKNFLNSYAVFLKTKTLIWEKVKPISNDLVKNYTSLPDITDLEISKLIKRLVVIKLNGGLGTTMGCSFPKSLITVRNGMNFLDITMLQLNTLNSKYKCDVPLILMNSYSTNEKTNETLPKYRKCSTKIYTFIQSQYPRISEDSLLPICNDSTIKDSSCWFPPGHGNFYEAFLESGLMKKFIDEGKDIAFVSNIDNLGATVDLKILKLMSQNQNNNGESEFLMELTEKTKADVKGGTLIDYDGDVHLLEIAQVPKQYIEDFKLITKFKLFNTNNIWMNLRKIYEKQQISPLELDVIANKKTISDGLNIIQLETAIGAAVKNFKGCLGLNVPRSRFLPVKNNSDLLLIMSNLYELVDGELKMNQNRLYQSTPIIQLSGSYFKNVKDFLSRFESIPNILELDHLVVSGDVNFDRDVTLKGTVIISPQHGEHIDIPRGSILENKIISGNLWIVDH